MPPTLWELRAGARGPCMRVCWRPEFADFGDISDGKCMSVAGKVAISVPRSVREASRVDAEGGGTPRT